MNQNNIEAIIQHRKFTHEEWVNDNPVLFNGEIIFIEMEDGSLKQKIGDGVSTYLELDFYTDNKNFIIPLETDQDGHISTIIDECYNKIMSAYNKGKNIYLLDVDNNVETLIPLFSISDEKIIFMLPNNYSVCININNDINILPPEKESIKVDLSNYYNKEEINQGFSKKSTTLEGYGIIDAYTKKEMIDVIDERIKNYREQKYDYIINITGVDKSNNIFIIDKTYAEILSTIKSGKTIAVENYKGFTDCLFTEYTLNDEFIEFYNIIGNKILTLIIYSTKGPNSEDGRLDKYTIGSYEKLLEKIEKKSDKIIYDFDETYIITEEEAEVADYIRSKDQFGNDIYLSEMQIDFKIPPGTLSQVQYVYFYYQDPDNPTKTKQFRPSEFKYQHASLPVRIRVICYKLRDSFYAVLGYCWYEGDSYTALQTTHGQRMHCGNFFETPMPLRGMHFNIASGSPVAGTEIRIRGKRVNES